MNDISKNEIINILIDIFDKNMEKRIVVLGTSCTGKTTIIKMTKIGLDMDEEIFPLLTEDEKEYVCRTPWNEEVGNYMDSLVKTKLKVTPGMPLFGTVLLKCDLIIYLHINDSLLRQRTKKRNVKFSDAKNMQSKIEEEIKKSNIECINIEIEE